MFQRTRLRRALMALLPAGALLAGTGATPAMADATFKIVNRSGFEPGGARFYYLGYGMIGKDFVVLGADGRWITAGRAGSGWASFGWNPSGGKKGKGAHTGSGIVPCHPVTASSTVTIPPNIAGSRVYFFQVRRDTKLYNTPCHQDVDPRSRNVRGVFRNSFDTTGQAPFSYFSKTGNGGLVGASLTQLTRGDLMGWTASAPAQCAKMWSLPNATQEAAHGRDYDDWSGHRQARFPGSRSRCSRECRDQEALETR